jgi:cell division septal protein FtsQ
LFQKEENLQREIKRKIQQNNGKIIFFLIALFISIALLIFVFYFAVNKTYVYIKPEMTVKTV